MIKKIIIALLFLLLIAYAVINKPEKFKLDDIYYNTGDYINVDADYLKDLTHNNYILFVHNSFCAFKTPCDTIFKEYMQKYKIDFLTINIDDYKETDFYSQVKYAPSILIVKDNKIVAYLNAEKDSDLDKYQDAKAFEKWINEFIITKK